MGNEQSSGVIVDEKAVEVTDFWVHHTATFNSGATTPISVFVGEPLIGGSLWISHTPLEKAAKNLMVYRHPSILKFISSWHKSSKFYLAVEDIKPLSHVLLTQNTLQICVGLYSILKALCFLHEKAQTSHNNVCMASIYVTKDGSWKLGGMEYLCRVEDLTLDYLNKTKSHRYNKAVDPNENKNILHKTKRIDLIDGYAFGVLVNEVLKKKNDEEISMLTNFCDTCKNELQQVDILLRPKLSSLLEHQFFNHDFIMINSFLAELPLKSDAEKADFFSNLVDKLRTFNEVVVARQLGGLLLSRMVLLDKTAQTELLPYILYPRDSENNCDGLFSTETFQQHLIPRLLQIFCVRDAQIRLLLLNHFMHYVKCFSVDELQSHILPELLVGIKDTNDYLVAVTLRALADLVPILGAATVIGGKRAKLFNDGRPIIHPTRKFRRNSRRSHDSLPGNDTSQSLSISDIDLLSARSAGVEENQILELPERPSPDGEEGETSTEDIEQSVEEELDNWEDWDINEGNTTNSANSFNVDTNSNVFTSTENVNSTTDSDLLNVQENLVNLSLNNSSDVSQNFESNVQPTPANDLETSSSKRKLLPDILELDIRNQLGNSTSEDFDFFQDMEPVIQTSTKFLISENSDNQNNINNNDDGKIRSKKFDLSVKEIESHIEGWGEDLDWN